MVSLDNYHLQDEFREDDLIMIKLSFQEEEMPTTCLQRFKAFHQGQDYQATLCWCLKFKSTIRGRILQGMQAIGMIVGSRLFLDFGIGMIQLDNWATN